MNQPTTVTKHNFYTTWSDIDEWADGIASAFKEVPLDFVVGVVRGGIIPAGILSYRLNVPSISLQWQLRDLDKKTDHQALIEILISSQKGILIVDDVLDSGKTLKQIHDSVATIQNSMYKELLGPVHYAVCVRRQETFVDFDVYAPHEEANFNWVYFPWEPENK